MTRKKPDNYRDDDTQFDPAPAPAFEGEGLIDPPVNDPDPVTSIDQTTKRDGTSDPSPGTEPDPLVPGSPSDVPHRKGDFAGAGVPAGTPGYDDAGVFDRDRPGWSASHDASGLTVAPGDPNVTQETHVEAAKRTAAAQPSDVNLDALVAATRHETLHGVQVVRPNDHTALHGIDSILGGDGVKDFRINRDGRNYVQVGEWGGQRVYRPD